MAFYQITSQADGEDYGYIEADSPYEAIEAVWHSMCQGLNLCNPNAWKVEEVDCFFCEECGDDLIIPGLCDPCERALRWECRMSDLVEGDDYYR